MTERILHSFF